MLLRRGFCRPSQTEINEIESLREFVRKAAEILKRLPKPDTFLGRKTQEPFPKEATETRRDQVGGVESRMRMSRVDRLMPGLRHFREVFYHPTDVNS